MTTSQLFKGLQSGKRYQVKGKSGYGNDIYLVHDQIHNMDFIGWTCHGSSANENNLEGLNFILNTIFKLNADSFQQAI